MTRWHLGRRRFLMSTAAAGAGLAMPGIIRANAADATVNKWIDEFQPSTLSRDAQVEELTWFQNAAQPFKGMQIKVVVGAVMSAACLGLVTGAIPMQTGAYVVMFVAVLSIVSDFITAE